MMTTPDQGDGPSQRDGKEIAMLYLQINGQCIPQKKYSRSTQGCSVFVAIVLDTQTNAAQMNSEDCFKNTSTGSKCGFRTRIYCLARDSGY